MRWAAAPERPARVPPPDADVPPQRRLAPGARWAWRVHLLLVWIALGVAAWLLVDVVDFARTLFFAATIVVFAPAVVFVPRLRYRRWRWDVRPDVIDIQHGTFTVRRTLVPLERVQHVDTKRDVLEQLLELSTVVVHTAAGSHTIPYLSDFDAGVLRNRIASLARAADG